MFTYHIGIQIYHFTKKDQINSFKPGIQSKHLTYKFISSVFHLLFKLLIRLVFFFFQRIKDLRVVAEKQYFFPPVSSK